METWITAAEPDAAPPPRSGARAAATELPRGVGSPGMIPSSASEPERSRRRPRRRPKPERPGDPMNAATRAPGTFADLWQRAVDQHERRPFLVFRSEDGEIDTWTYGEIDRVVRDTMALLAANGVGAGDAVHLCLRNCPAFIALWLACGQLGAWMVPVDPASTSRDVESQLARV